MTSAGTSDVTAGKAGTFHGRREVTGGSVTHSWGFNALPLLGRMSQVRDLSATRSFVVVLPVEIGVLSDAHRAHFMVLRVFVWSRIRIRCLQSFSKAKTEPGCCLLLRLPDHSKLGDAFGGEHS